MLDQYSGTGKVSAACSSPVSVQPCRSVKERVMYSLRLPKILGVLSLFAFFTVATYGATITGTVKGPDGTPFRGAFVQAQNVKNRITVNVLSDKTGRYHVEDLPAGEYTVRIKAVGYKVDPHTGVNLTADQNATFDFALQKGTVHWNEISNYMGTQLLPKTEDSGPYFSKCFECHGFQSRESVIVRDEDGWRGRVDFMRTAFARDFHGFTDEDENKVVSYLTKLWGPDSVLPKSPADLPRYQEIKPQFSDEAMKIVYVSYALPQRSRFPGTAKIEKDGKAWMWDFDHSVLGKLDPKTGVVTEYQIPGSDYAGNHSTYMAPNGIVWFTEAENNTLGALDPQTGKIAQYHPTEPGGKHTVVVDSKGVVWTSGSPLTSFDPKTEKFKYFPEVPNLYGVTLDQQDNIWVAVMSKNGYIGKVDAQTAQVTKYTPPTPNAFARRIKVAPNGMVWFCEYQAGAISSSDPASETQPINPFAGVKYHGKIASFDPKTEKFREYELPGASPTPYALTIDNRNRVWYSSKDMDTVGELDPATGKVIEYPFIFSENGIRDFFADSEGRIWWGSQPNDYVGYFYLAPNGAGEKTVADNQKK